MEVLNHDSEGGLPIRRIVIGAVILAVIVIAATLTVVNRPHHPPHRRVTVPTVQADALARKACDLTVEMIQQINDNGSTNTVLSLADRARSAASDAAYSNPHWVLLASSVQALYDALHSDDPHLAALGMEQVAPACFDTGVDLPSAAPSGGPS